MRLSNEIMFLILFIYPFPILLCNVNGAFKMGHVMSGYFSTLVLNFHSTASTFCSISKEVCFYWVLAV